MEFDKYLYGVYIHSRKIPIGGIYMEEKTCPCCGRKKSHPRNQEEVKDLQSRLNRISGQINGISKMLDENRYCGDVLIQVAAVENALQSFGYILLKEHMDTCVVEDIQNGKLESVDEAFELMRKLK